jgi:hypothetical protein
MADVSVPGGPHAEVIHEGTVTSVDISGREDVQKLRAGSVGRRAIRPASSRPASRRGRTTASGFRSRSTRP